MLIINKTSGIFMKKNILFITCLSTSIAHAMNNQDNNVFSIIHHETQINVTKGSISSDNLKVHRIYVGYNQQISLEAPLSYSKLRIGQIIPTFGFGRDSIIYEKNKDDESDSDDDICKPFNLDKQNKQQLWLKPDQKDISTLVFRVVEPRLHKVFNNNTQQDEDYYDEQRTTLTFKAQLDFHTHDGYSYSCIATGEKAVQEASKDLKNCYDLILNHKISPGIIFAIDALSTEVGIPREIAAPIAIKTILDFIDKNSKTFDRIELFVKKHSEFKMYKQLLLKPFAQKSYLFLNAAKNNPHIFMLPQEIIKYILQLTIICKQKSATI